jgi:hypothetical protein
MRNRSMLVILALVASTLTGAAASVAQERPSPGADRSA